MEYLIVYEILYSFGEQLIDSLLKRTPKFIRPPLVSILKHVDYNKYRPVYYILSYLFFYLHILTFPYTTHIEYGGQLQHTCKPTCIGITFCLGLVLGLRIWVAHLVWPLTRAFCITDPNMLVSKRPCIPMQVLINKTRVPIDPMRAPTQAGGIWLRWPLLHRASQCTWSAEFTRLYICDPLCEKRLMLPFLTEKTIEIQLVRPTEVCHKV